MGLWQLTATLTKGKAKDNFALHNPGGGTPKKGLKTQEPLKNGKLFSLPLAFCFSF